MQPNIKALTRVTICQHSGLPKKSGDSKAHKLKKPEGQKQKLEAFMMTAVDGIMALAHKTMTAENANGNSSSAANGDLMDMITPNCLFSWIRIGAYFLFQLKTSRMRS